MYFVMSFGCVLKIEETEMLSCLHLTVVLMHYPSFLVPILAIFLYIFHFISISSSLEFNVKVCKVKKKKVN